MQKYVAYYRVSTGRQQRSGLGLDAQREAVRAFVRGPGDTLFAEVTEIESGKRHENRPKLTESLRLCSVTGATLIVAKLDRLSRDAAFLLTLQNSGVRFIAADMPHANTLTVGVMALVAQQEREAISARTKAALAAARARGVRLGGDRGHPLPSREAAAASGRIRQKRSLEHSLAVLPEIEVARREGAKSLREIASFLDQRGVRTPRGKGQWHAGQVKVILDKCAAGSTSIPPPPRA